MSISRRSFVKQGLLAAGAVATGLVPSPAPGSSHIPKVYFSRELSAESLLRLYGMVSRSITGRVAVKLHTADLIATYLMEQGTSSVENGH